MLMITISVLKNAQSQLITGKLSPGINTKELSVFVTDHTNLVQSLFKEINLNYPGLEKTRTAVQKLDWPNASKELLNYFRNKKQPQWLHDCAVSVSDSIMTEANEVLKNTYTFQGVKSVLPVKKESNRDWYYTGPAKDIEWAYFLNRTMYFNSLRMAYCKTSNPIYPEAFNALILDWIVNNPTPAGKTDNATWRALETGLRLALSWPMLFYQLQHAKEFSEVTRLLMLASIIDHAAYTRKNHWVHHNHGVMELNGLVTAALLFPELNSSKEWYNHSLIAMKEEFSYQSYPDGAMKELTNSYHIVVIRNFFQFIDIHNKTGKTLPPYFNEVVENMCNYMAYTSRPDGFGLLNNDSDLKDNFDF